MNLKNLFVISSILSLLNVAQGAFQIKEEAKKYIDITHDGKTVARVMTAYDQSTPESKHETYKVYTHIFDKHGKAPITKGAGGAFTHHRGIFLGWSKTRFSGKSVDSWHMKGCVQVYKKIIDSKADDKSASLTILIQWISSDGIVSVQVPGQVEAEEVGQLQLADFANPTGLQPIGQNLLVETPASGPPIVENPFANGFGKLVQGALESSNVNVVQELVDMIETQRAYEINSKAISGVDDMLRFVNQNL